MAGVPEVCERCGRTNTAGSVISFGPDADIADMTVIGGQGRCPYCGGRTRVLEGRFDVRDGVIEALSAPDWTKARLLELQHALRDAQHLAAKDVGAAVARVAEVDHRTAGLLLRQVLASKELIGITALLTVLLAAVGILVTLYVAGQESIKPDDLQRIVDEQIREHLEERNGEDAPPTPEPPAAPGSAGPVLPA